MKAIVLGLTAGLFVILAGCAGKKTTERPESVSVKTMIVGNTELSSGYNYVGTVEASLTSALSFEVGGNIQAVYADEGRRVKKGELLAVLDQTTLKNMYDAAASTLTQARDAYARYEKLHNSGSMPEIKWVEVESKLQQSVSAEAVAKKNLNDSKLYAPFAGVIASRNADPGMNVAPGQPVLKLADVSEVEIKLSVPENEISRLQIGQTASFSVAALGGKTYRTAISKKGIAANPLSHTYDVKLACPNPDGELMPGMVCDVTVLGESGESSVVIPADAVQLDADSRRFVWVVEEHVARQRFVTPGRLTATGITISEGLSRDDRIIVSGGQKVSEGMKVTWE